MRLYVISDYRNRGVHYEPGQILEVSPAEYAHLLVDAPGCFSVSAPKGLDKPPADKMIKRGKVTK